MSNITRWNPYDEIQRMREDFSRIFSPFMSVWGNRDDLQGATWSPSIDLRETETEFHISAEVPGVDPENLDVTVTEDTFTIRGEVKRQSEFEDAGVRRVERRYGSFHRSISFPSPVEHEKAHAEYRNGILEVRIPKAAPSKGKTTRLQIGAPRSQEGTDQSR